MKFKCVNNDGMEHRLKLGKVYDGSYDYNQKDEYSKPMVRIDEDEDGLPTLYLSYRFECL